eukprot:RCo012816
MPHRGLRSLSVALVVMVAAVLLTTADGSSEFSAYVACTSNAALCDTVCGWEHSQACERCPDRARRYEFWCKPMPSCFADHAKCIYVGRLSTSLASLAQGVRRGRFAVDLPVP